MSAPRLTPGRGKSPRLIISMTDAQRRALEELSIKTGRSAAQVAREALDAFLASLPAEEVARAS
jgi:predicted DNA-binding protein